MLSKWCVYILECRNGHLYTGITNDLERRLGAHRKGGGAKYTRAFGAVKMVYRENQPNRSTASKRESEIKSWTRKQKLEFIQARN